jgi:hypothetical protein
MAKSRGSPTKLRKPRKRVFVVPDNEALDRILATIELGAPWRDHLLGQARHELARGLQLAVSELNERPALQKIGHAHAALDRLLRAHNRGSVANEIANLMQRKLLTARKDVGDRGDRPGIRIVALPWSMDMLMGNYLLDAYVVLTGQLPKMSREGKSGRSRAGEVAKFVREALRALKVEVSEDAVIKAMQRFGAVKHYKARA